MCVVHIVHIALLAWLNPTHVSRLFTTGAQDASQTDIRAVEQEAQEGDRQ